MSVCPLLINPDGSVAIGDDGATLTVCEGQPCVCCEGVEPGTLGYVLTRCVCDESEPEDPAFYLPEETSPLPSVIRLTVGSTAQCFQVAGTLSDVTGLSPIGAVYDELDDCEECCPPPCCERTGCSGNKFICWWLEKQDPVTFVWVPQITVTTSWQYTVDYDCCNGSTGAPKPDPCPTISHSGGGTLTFKSTGAANIGDYGVERCDSGGWKTIDATTRLVCGCIVGIDGRALAVDIPHAGSPCHPTAGADSTRDISTGFAPRASTCADANITGSNAFSFFGPSPCNAADTFVSNYRNNDAVSCQQAEVDSELVRRWTLCQTSSGNFPNLVSQAAQGDMTMTVDGVFDCEAPEAVAAMLDHGAGSEEILSALAERRSRRTVRTATQNLLDTVDTEEDLWLV